MGGHMTSPVFIDGVPLFPGPFLPRPGRTFFLAAGGNNGSGLPLGSDSHTGKSWDQPFLTMERFLDDVKTFDRLYFMGDVREEGLIGSNLAFDVQIIGVGSRHHPDVPSALYHPGASMIRPPSSPTAATPVLTLRGRGWQFHNVAFVGPADAAAVLMQANALSDVSEYDASHATFNECEFIGAYRGIQDDGGVINVRIKDCVFRLFSTASGRAIVSTSTSVRTPQYWRIVDTEFPANAASGGNEGHIDSPLNGGVIKGCTFGTVEGTGLYIDLTGGTGNIVTKNLLQGNYDTTDYVPGTGDDWTGNNSTNPSSKATVGDNGWTHDVPGA